MNSFEEQKAIIGHLICYYRTNSHITKQSLYTHICDAKTLTKIESGEIIKNEMIYEKLCLRLGKLFLLKQSIFDKLIRYHDLMIHHLLHFSKNNLYQLKVLLEKDLVTYQNILGIEEKLQLLLDIILCYLENKPTDLNQLSFYEAIHYQVSYEGKKLITLLRYRNTYFNPSNQIALIEECVPYFDDPLFFHAKLAHIFIHYPSFERYNRISIYLTELNSLTRIQKIDLYDRLSMLHLNSHSLKDAYLHMHKCLDLLNDNFPDFLFSKVFIKLGIITYMQKNYQECIHSFTKAIKIKPESLLLNYLLLFHSYEALKRTDDLIQLLQDIQITTQNKYMTSIFTYYRMKYLLKTSKAELEEYLVDHLIDLCTFGKIYDEIITEEFYQLVTSTHHYKLCYLLIEKRKNSSKNSKQ